MKNNIPRKKTIMIIAGEASGDMHGANLVWEMLQMNPSLSFYGIGGKRLREAGVELFADVAQMAVVGVSEVFAKLGDILKTMRMMKKSLDTRRPDLVILIDYPDFNLPLARAAHQKGIRVFYYISPQVWAWRKGRIAQIKKNVDKMAVILPFEVDTYRENGFDVHYVGHPLLDMIKDHYAQEETKKQIGIDARRPTIALMPGSRLAEVKTLLPELMKAAAVLKSQIADIQFVLPLAETLDEKTVREYLLPSHLPVKVVSGNTYEVIASADLALVASGTATLETALLNVPMVIVYKVSLLSYLIGRTFIHVKNIGLVNIVAGKTIVPELIQADANGQRIAQEALSILTNREKYHQMKQDLAAVRARLGEPGAARRAAQIALNMI
ncbi:MAG TPA: lipid-A-disaccharide synthase [Smithella sp.]|nr:lipid-A-disaccharide synthase [Smithella sp.]